MPIDFTAYTDPGIYVELIDPPVNNTTAITPTVVALVGAAGEEGRQIVESTTLRSQYSTTLSAKGINPFSLSVRSYLKLDQYTSAAFGKVHEYVAASDNTASVIVDKKDGFTLPDGIANADFDDYRLIIDNRVYDATLSDKDETSYTFTISGLLDTGVSSIEEGAIVNLFAPYVTPVKVGTLRAQAIANQDLLNSGTPDFKILQYKKSIQKVKVLKSTSDFTITYDETDVDLKDGSSWKTAKAVAEELSAAKAVVTKFETTESATTYVNYVIAFGVDDPELLTTESSDIDITAQGLSAGDLILIGRERLAITWLDPFTTDTETQTEIVKLDVLRGRDGTLAVSHGTDDVYLTSGYDYSLMVDAGEDAVINGVDDVTIVTPVTASRLAPLDSEGVETTFSEGVEIRGRSTNAKQYAPEVFSDLDDIRDKYGKPITSTQTPLVESSLTLAAQIALRNGANRVYCVAVETNDVEGFETAIDKLANIDEINVIVPITTGFGLSANEQVISKLGEFCATQANQGNLLRAFVSIDGNANTVAASDFKSLAQRINDARVSLVAPGRFTLQTSSGKVSVGGQFAAAAVAGLHAGLEVQMPLTRKQLELSVYAVEDPFTGAEMLDLQSNGVLVISQESGRRIIIRHGLTTDMSSVYSREVSVVAARDRLRDLVYGSLLTAGILGSPITANTPELVVSNVTGALELAKRATLIFDYADVKYRVPTNNPTAIEIRFAYRPTMPLNYVLVQFSVDTTSSSVTFQSITEGGV